MSKKPNPAPNHGPYRTADPPKTQRPWQIPTIVWIAVGCFGGAAALAGIVNSFHQHSLALVGQDPFATLRDTPSQLLSFGSGSFTFPAADPDLPTATPLRPLLVADAPDALSILEPGEGVQRLLRGQTMQVRFNRPMVRARDVGKTAENPPIRFEPEASGRFHWASRSTLIFTPARETFDALLEAQMEVVEGTASLDGEELYDDLERVVFFDGSPRFISHRSTISAGQPLSMLFDSRVIGNDLANELFAWDVEGRRPVPVSISTSGFDEQGRFQVALNPRRSLEAGARINVALAPRYDGYGSYPRVVTFSLAPSPRITGIACTVSQWGTANCAYTESPGQIVDIGAELVFRTSEALADAGPEAVRISPPLREVQVEVGGTGSEARRHLIIRGEWEPNLVYEVDLDLLRTMENIPVRGVGALAIRSAGHPPHIESPSGLLTYESDAPIQIPLRGVHIDDGRLVVRAVPEGREIEALISPSTFVTADPAFALALPELLPNARPNRYDRGRFDLRQNIADKMVVVGTHAGSSAEPRFVNSAFIQSTDLGVSTEVLQSGMIVWVTSLATGAPIEGARIALHHDAQPTSAQGVTDADGVAFIPRDTSWSAEPSYVLVRTDSDRAVLRTSGGVGPSALGVASGTAPPSTGALRATVVADRGAYRPGEPIHALAIARFIERATARKPADQSMTFRLMSSSSELPLSEHTVSMQGGRAEASWALPESTPLGEHTIQFVDAEGALIGATEIRVAEFRQPTFRVDLEREREPLHDGDDLQFGIEAMYLFGTPLEGAEAKWRVLRAGRASLPSRYRDFSIGPVGTGSLSGTADEGEGTTEHGSLQVRSTLALSQSVRSRIRIEADVTDNTGESSSASEIVTVYPADFDVALRHERAWLPWGEAVSFDILAIGNDDQPALGKALTARIVREGWHGWWEWQDGQEEQGEGAYQLRRNQRREVVHTCSLISAEEPVTCSFDADRAGTYLLEVEGRDSAGRTTIAQSRVYLAGRNEYPDRDPPGAPIALTPARAQWSVGEEAEIAFESPWPAAEALIAVHDGELLSFERREVGPGAQIIRVPITERMVPNTTVTLTLIRPRSGPPGPRADLNAPDLRFGAVQLSARPRLSRLAVSVEAPTELRPGREAEITVSVRDSEGNPVRSDVALWAVDEGTLRLTGYTTPHPTRAFFAEHGASFTLDDLRRYLQSRVDPAVEAEASGDGSEADMTSAMDLEARERFDPTPIWQPLLTTDADGVATVRFTLPERPTEYRIQAIAIDDGLRAGSASSQIVAEQPLVVREAFPRFTTNGDRFQAVAFVHNRGDAALTANVHFERSGQALPTRALEIPAHGEVRVEEPIAIDGSEHVVELSIHASAEVPGEGPFTQTKSLSIPVVPAARWVRRHAMMGGTSVRDITLDYGDLDDNATRGQLRVAVAGHPFVGMDGALDALDDVWWGGTANAAAKLLAYASYLRISDGLEIPGRQMEERRLRARNALREVLGARDYQGGFGRWAGDSSYGTSPYETVYATRALIAAEHAGMEIPPGIIRSALDRLEQMIQGGEIGRSYGRAGYELWALALRLLADDGRRGPSLESLWQQREFASPGALAELAMALPEDDTRRETALMWTIHKLYPQLELPGLTDEDAGVATASPHEYVERDVHAVGPALAAVTRVDPTIRENWGRILATDLIQLSGHDGGMVGYPDEIAETMAALSEYALAFGQTRTRDFGATLKLDEQALSPRSEGRMGALYDLPWSSVIAGEHTLEARTERSNEPVFVALDSLWSIPIGPAEQAARGSGVSLHRVYELENGTRIEEGTSVPLGTMLRVRLYIHVESGSPENLALRDSIPAGFVAVDSGFNTSPGSALRSLLGIGPDDDAMDPRGYHAMRTIGNVEHRTIDTHAVTHYLTRLSRGLHEITYAIRATTPGTFVVPPAFIEAAHDPDFVGRSAAGSVTVE